MNAGDVYFVTTAIMNIEQELLQKEELTSLIKKTKSDLDCLVKKIIRGFIRKEENIEKIHEVFAYVYEHLYHDIMFEKLPLDKKTARLMELLATPMAHKPLSEQKDILKRVFRRAQCVRTKFSH
jgi:uncharacterized protein YdiU (UPF0061 family)